MRGNAKRTAVCGVFAACAIIVMLFGTIVEVFDLTSAAIASSLVFILANAYGRITSSMLYIVIGVLSFILFPGKFSPISFILIGAYPIAKNILDSKFQTKPIRWFFKILLFNIGFTVFLFVAKSFIFSFGENGNISIYEKIFVYPIGNLFIVLFDIALDKLIYKYGNTLSKLLM